MTPEQAVELVARWPMDRSVPKKLKTAHDQARGLQRTQIGSLVEALYAAANGPNDLDLIAKYWG